MKILGITLTTNVYDIWDFNSVEVLNKVNSMLKQCSKRKLTLLYAYLSESYWRYQSLFYCLILSKN